MPPKPRARSEAEELKARVGSRLKEFRKTRELTQEALAEAADRSVDAISALERGLVLPSFETLERLAVVLDVPLAAFFDSAVAGESRRRAALRARLAALVHDLPDEYLAVAVDQVAALASAVARQPRTTGR